MVRIVQMILSYSHSTAAIEHGGFHTALRCPHRHGDNTVKYPQPPVTGIMQEFHNIPGIVRPHIL